MLIRTFICICAAASVLAAGTSPNFIGSRQYRAGGYNLQFVIADMNHDGIPDAIASGGEGTVLMLGSPGGKFRPPVSIYPASAFSTVVADFNNDGNADLVLSALGNGTYLVVLLGRGDGTFQAPITLQNACIDCYLSVADFNRDGKMDLAVASTNSFQVYLGNGDGTFSEAKATYSTQFAVYSATGDLNGDNIPDTVVVDSGNLDVFLGMGDGTFHETRYPSALTGFQVQLVDLNGDGKLDIVAQDRDSDQVIVRLNQGNGIFGAAATFPGGCPFGACDFQSISTGDINGDGRIDVVTPGSYLLGNGDGTFQSPVSYYGGGNYAAIADLDRNGIADIVATGPNSIDLTVVRSRGAEFPQAPVFLAGGEPEDVAYADFNGDRTIDLAVADYANNRIGAVHILLNGGKGVFFRGIDLPVEHPGAILTGDFNGDGLADLAVSSQSTGTTIFLGQGNGQFTQGQTYSGLYGDCTNHAINYAPAVCFAVADVNGDGILDLAGANWIDGQITVMLGNGDGTFRVGQSFAGASGQTGLAIADLNGDGKPDLVFSGSFFGASFYLGRGDGTFGAEHLIGSQLFAGNIAVGDVTGDGIPDVVLAGGQSASSLALANSYFPALGGGAFGPEVFIPADLAPNAVALVDVNGDGRLDIVSANFAASNASISVNLGNAMFDAPVFYATGASPCQLAVADFSGDGRADVVVVDQGSTITELVHAPF